VHPLGPNPVETLDKLRAALITVGEPGQPIVLSSDKVNAYLDATASTGVDRSLRLIALANGLARELGWEQICNLYEQIISTQPQDEHLGTLSTWLTIGMQEFMPQINDIPHEKGVAIADKVAEILRRALAVSPSNPGLATIYGLLYYRYPLSNNDHRKHLEQAIEWFEKSILWSAEDYGEIDTTALIHLGHCNFELEEWREALKTYAAIYTLSPQGLPEAVDQQIQERIAKCQIELDRAV